jgi:uncharacterized membrane protein YphA (DoxX/SURF4 family)
MNKLLWLLQILLAIAFGLAGTMKLITPLDQLAIGMDWVSRVPAWATRLSAFVEVLGAIGLVLPAATRIKPQLTAWAALGLAAVMLLAAVGVHLPAAEWPDIMRNVMLGGLAAMVAYGRFKKAPISPKE